MLNNLNTSVVVEAKKEYTKHICNILTPILHKGFQNIYNNVRKNCEKKRDNQILINFQLVLKQIPSWNDEILEKEYARIKNQPNCDWLDDLIKAVFISNVKILSSIRKRNKKFELQLPSSKRFIHKCYIESAREFFQSPGLFSHKISNENDLYRNLREIKNTIQMSIEESIRKLLPVQHILQQYLGDDFEDEENEDISQNGPNANLKKMVQQELQSMGIGDTNQTEQTEQAEQAEQTEQGMPNISQDLPRSPKISQDRKIERSKEEEDFKTEESKDVSRSKTQEEEDNPQTTAEVSEAIPITPNKYRSLKVSVEKPDDKPKSPKNSRKFDMSNIDEESNIFFSDAEDNFSD